MKNCKLYTLNHPVTNEIRYVGYTSSSLEERLRYHLKDFDTKSPNSHKNKWIRKLVSENLKPTINLITDNLTRDEAIFLEIKTIFEYRLNGIDLTNNTDGGEGGTGYKFSKEKRQEISNKIRGRKLAPCSEERKNKISVANKGRKLTDEQKIKMCLGIKKRFENPEERLKLSLLNKGKKLSDETKAKMSEARRKEWAEGKRKHGKWSDDRREIRKELYTGRNNPFYGKTHSKETIEKIKSKVFAKKEQTSQKMKDAWVVRKARSNG